MEVDISKKAGYVVKYGLIGLVAAAVICAGLVWRYQHQQSGYSTYKAQIAGKMVNIRARVNGKITELTASNGDKVAKDEVIAKIAVSVTEDEIHQLEQNLALAQQSLAEVQKGHVMTTPVVTGGGGYDPEAQSRLAQAEARLQRMNELLEMGAISAKKRDEAAADYEAAQAVAGAMTAPSVSYQTTIVPSSPEAIKAAELQVRQAEAALKTAQADAQATEITAPVEGTLYWQNVTAETEIKAGQTVAGVGDATGLWLEARVPPQDLAQIQLGQLAVYEINGKSYNGTVTELVSLQPETPTANTDGVKAEGEPEATPEPISLVKISLAPEILSQVKPGVEATVKLQIAAKMGK